MDRVLVSITLIGYYCRINLNVTQLFRDEIRLLARHDNLIRVAVDNPKRGKVEIFLEGNVVRSNQHGIGGIFVSIVVIYDVRYYDVLVDTEVKSMRKIVLDLRRTRYLLFFDVIATLYVVHWYYFNATPF